MIKMYYISIQNTKCSEIGNKAETFQRITTFHRRACDCLTLKEYHMHCTPILSWSILLDDIFQMLPEMWSVSGVH